MSMMDQPSDVLPREFEVSRQKQSRKTSFPLRFKSDSHEEIRTRGGLGEKPSFAVRCEPKSSNAMFPSAGLAVYLGQAICKKGRAEIWDSIIVRCEEEKDGTLSIRIIVSNPDWDQLLQIACIRSQPHDTESMTPLACNLDHEVWPE